MGPEIFDSAIRAKGDLAGVFEYDNETGYFYLHNVVEPGQIVGSLHIFSGKTDFSQADVAVRWSECQRKVGLLIRGILWAVFDDHGARYGGNYEPGAEPSLPPEAGF
jgi:hypothetical protein